MSQDGGKGRRGQDGRGSSGSSFVWYMILVAIGVTAVAFYISSFNTLKIDYPDLVDLIKASKPAVEKTPAEEPATRSATSDAEQPTGDTASEVATGPSRQGAGRSTTVVSNGIVITRKSGDAAIRVKLTNPRDLELHEQSLSGKVDQQIVRSNGSPEGPPEAKDFSTQVPKTEATIDELTKLLDESNIHYVVAEQSLLRNHGPLLLLTALLIVFFIIMMRRLTGAGSPMSFGRSRGRLYAQEDLGVTFDDVAGIDEAVEEVKEVVDFLRNAEKYQRLGGRIPKGVLLVGPPGTGKTLLAKAIAGEAGVPFFSLSGSDFVEMFVGVGAARVRDMFQQAESKAPCIIFIDELDALGKSRGTSIIGGHDEREQTLNALLVEMDGFDSNAGVIVMAATNRPETLDQALLRPGRFDRHVLVDRPDIRGREAILKVHVKSVKLDDSVELAKVAGLTPGFVGADLANLVNEAALLAARADKSTVGMREFNEGVERVTAGLEKKQRVMNDDEKQRVAYHEAGHALVAYSLPNTDPVHKVSIIPRGLAALGYTMQRPDGDRFLMTQSELDSRIQVLLAGTIAEEMVYRDISTGAQNDLERATEIARSMVMEYGMSELGRVNYRDSNRSAFLATGGGDEGLRSHSERTAREIDEEVKRIVDDAIEKVRHILALRRAALEALTNRLIEIESVDADELKAIVERTAPRPAVAPGTTPSEFRPGSVGGSAPPASTDPSDAAPSTDPSSVRKSIRPQ